MVRRANPNVAYYAIADLERGKLYFLLATQNVDNLHILAGITNVIELPGDIFRTRCTRCLSKFPAPTVSSGLPVCQYGGLLRPDIIWLGEALNRTDLEKSYQSAPGAALTLVVGTSGIVQPAASLRLIAKRNGSFIVEINTERTPITEVADIAIHRPSVQVLREIV